MADYDKPYVHGSCTYGFVCCAILDSGCENEPANFTSLSGRFADQVWFGDTIITNIRKTEPSEAIVQAETQSGSVMISQRHAAFAH
jgi:acyl dehydratase|tara:strand:- start:303 stop:560 length:258 start_codon:yes stop_codon:yes gene_type:complete